MHFFGLLGSFIFVIGFIAVLIVGGIKLYCLRKGIPAPLITNTPYFYVALTSMIIGTQLFLAGFIGELITRNSSERNRYIVSETID